MKLIKYIIAIALINLIASCKKFLDVELPKSQLASHLVFSTDITATSAVTGIYYNFMEVSSFASGTPGSVVALAGLSADELDNYIQDPSFLEFQGNALTPKNEYVHRIWASMYKAIYDANAVAEGLDRSQTVSAATKKQLMGEALFVRAFCHFYLVNLFGDVPLITTSDYRQNAKVNRTSVATVYNQIVKDLQFAQANLGDAYVSIEKVRPNKAAATALLARVYLYLGQWTNAEMEASSVINNANYGLSNLNDVFLANSTEAIWQLMPTDPSKNTWEGFYFIDGFDANVLTDQVVNAFETGDNRLTNWVGSSTGGTFYPYKYKIETGGPPVEYSMVLRLAEQYLIRAEARAEQNNISGAQSDINVIRARAGLPNTSANDQSALFSAIEQERRVELFTEWGHRWLDLKRWNRATTVLSSIKQGWTISDVLYPLPQSELNKNQNLKPQNPGY